MQKHQLNFIVRENVRLTPSYSLLTFTREDGLPLPRMLPGQFAEVLVTGAADTLLRRPISISSATADSMKMLVRRAGNATDRLCDMPAGSVIDIVLPLGNGFTTAGMAGGKVLLVGGGVGIAPLWFLAERLKSEGAVVTTLIGARTESMLLLRDELSCFGDLAVSTDDGSCGEKGFVTQNSVWNRAWDMVYVCGPAPMMKGVAAICREKGIRCEVSLENMMACGLGACLCCVEKTVRGNVCVCTEGPVFNINQLLW